jgi:hypothetical protein
MPAGHQLLGLSFRNDDNVARFEAIREDIAVEKVSEATHLDLHW